MFAGQKLLSQSLQGRLVRRLIGKVTGVEIFHLGSDRLAWVGNGDAEEGNRQECSARGHGEDIITDRAVFELQPFKEQTVRRHLGQGGDRNRTGAGGG